MSLFMLSTFGRGMLMKNVSMVQDDDFFFLGLV